MDDSRDHVRHPPNPYSFGSSNTQKIQYVDADAEDDDEEEENEEFRDEEDDIDDNNDNDGLSNTEYPVNVDNDDNDHDDATENDDDDEDLERHPKKRKLKSLISSYEFAPRVTVGPGPSKPTRNSPTDWSERETFTLLDSWGERYLQRGKKSLRLEEWQEVAERVSEVSSKSVAERTDTQCRNRLDTLKKKYKKEKLGPSSNWVFFKKMDLLLSSSSSPPPPKKHERRPLGLSCGLDSGEYVFMDPRVYLNRANGLDEMGDSPGNSDSSDDDDDGGSDGLPPKKRKIGREDKGGRDGESSWFRLIADSIHKFSTIYEKIEASKRQQMMEIEKMRMDFQRDLELQKKKIMESAHAEIAKIRRGDDDNIDGSAENGSG